MRKLLFFTVLVLVASSCSNKEPGFVLVKGGSFKNTKSNLYNKGIPMSDFYIGKYEVTQKEWMDVMGTNPSAFKGDNLPVEMVSWYECIEYCNKRSVKEGLKPYYTINKGIKDTNNISELDSIKWTVTINEGANGYRLPTESEWEYAAGGGIKSKSYTYSGSENIEKVAWYWQNSGDEPLKGDWHRVLIKNNHCKSKPVGGKKSNELGLYDMSGNVREWCWDWLGDSYINNRGSDRALRGGGWLGADDCCTSSFRGSNDASSRFNDQGFRLCRSK